MNIPKIHKVTDLRSGLKHRIFEDEDERKREGFVVYLQGIALDRHVRRGMQARRLRWRVEG